MLNGKFHLLHCLDFDKHNVSSSPEQIGHIWAQSVCIRKIILCSLGELEDSESTTQLESKWKGYAPCCASPSRNSSAESIREWDTAFKIFGENHLIARKPNQDGWCRCGFCPTFFSKIIVFH
jgi:hypothetical protein